ncbi:hypothetical protein L7F22_016917 [Adiantum nelumboides]|nr:hypothetical protein [Adiantum nelumboides]
MSFSTFNGAAGEDAQEFLDNLEIACLVIGRDAVDATRLHVFPLLMKAEAKAWFNTLLLANRGDWARLRVLFLAKFGGGGETFESLWGKVCELRQGSLFEYNVYELQFVELWERWVALLRLGEVAPNFLKKDCFVAGLCPPLREKVKGRFPVMWMDAKDIGRLKERKIRYVSTPSIGGRGPPPNQEQARGPRRQAQEYHCYNCGENGHGMYYCPHPRRIGNFRGPRNQVSLPRERQQQQPPFPTQQAPPVQILRPPVQPHPQQPSPPPPIAPSPPLPIPENRAINVISLDAKVKVEEEEKGKSLPKDKGKAKVEDVDAMPIKRARQEEVAMSETGERRKSKENGESSSKKKSKPRRGRSRSKILHLDITPVLDAYVKGQRVSSVYVDGGVQICAMTEQTMQRFGLKVKVCEIEVEVDVYVMPTKGEVYPIILGRPWLMAMQARQDWGTGMLELQPHKGAKKGKAIHIDLKDGKHESLDLETSVDEFSSSDYSTSEEESTITDESDSSQAEIMGIGSSIGLASMLTHECYEEKSKLVSPKAGQGKEVLL